MAQASSEPIDFLHFNDVYHLNDAQTVGRFAATIEEERSTRESSAAEDAFLIFSGDALSPSLEASIYHGAHMIPLLDMLKVDVACPGNHDFDFGEARLAQLVEESKTPWTLCNYTKLGAPLTTTPIGKPLAGTRPYVIRRKSGYRFGFVGLGGTDWCDSTAGLPADYQVHDPITSARAMARHLRLVEGCDFVIAVTHMRLHGDLEVAQATAADDDNRVDLLLGGHDHYVVSRFEDDVADPDPRHIWPGLGAAELVRLGRVPARQGRLRIVKSGSDFKSYSKIRLNVSRDPSGRACLVSSSIQQTVKISDTITSTPPRPHRDISVYLETLKRNTATLINEPIAYLTSPLDGREAILRERETNLGSLVCDVIRRTFEADVALVNAGAIRCDRLIGANRVQISPGIHGSLLFVGDVLDIVPFQDTFKIKLLTGDQLKDLLEIAVGSDWPTGRFLQCSGIAFTVARDRPIGSRVSDVRFLGNTPSGSQTEGAKIWRRHASQPPSNKPPTPPLDEPALDSEEQKYAVVVPSFLAQGHDGFDMLRSLPTIPPTCSLKSQWTFAELLLDNFRHQSGRQYLPSMTVAGKLRLNRKSKRRQRLAVIQPPRLPRILCK